MFQGGNNLFYENLEENDSKKSKNLKEFKRNPNELDENLNYSISDSNSSFNRIKHENDFKDFKDKNQKESTKKWTIVGLDPGLTVGMAILDLNGNIIVLKSFKEASFSLLIREIIKHGRTAIVATDVYPPPKMVKKLSTSLNSKIHSPPKVMTIESKNEMVDEFVRLNSSNFSPNNAHQRDALAAAIKTYKNYEKKFNQIDKRSEAEELSYEEVEEIKYLFINGTPITKAFKILEESKNLPVIESNFNDLILNNELLNNSENDDLDSDASIIKLKKILKRQETQIKNQEAIIKSLRDKNKLLKNKVQKQKRELYKAKFKLEKVHQDYSDEILLEKQVASKITIINKIKDSLNKEKALRKELEEKLKAIDEVKSIEITDEDVPVKIIKSFTREGINESHQQWNIRKGDVVFLSNSGGGGSQTASLLAQFDLRAIIFSDKMPHQAREVLEDEEIPLIKSSSIEIEFSENLARVKSESLNNEIKKWENKIKNQRDKEEKEKLWNVIDEYRAKRKRDSLE